MKTVLLKDHAIFELPFGVIDDQGQVHKSFGLKTLTGEIRELVAQASKGKGAIEMVNNAMRYLVTNLGDTEVLDTELLYRMTVFDRDYILTVARAMRQPREEASQPCTECKAPVSLDEELVSTLEIKLPEASDFTIQGRDFTWLYSDAEVGIHECQMRVRTLLDEEDAFKGDRAKASFGAEHYLISKSIISLNGKGKVSPADVARMPVGMIDSLSEAFEDKDFGVDLRYLVDCDGCGTENTFKVDVLGSFLGLGRRRAKKTGSTKS